MARAVFRRRCPTSLSIQHHRRNQTICSWYHQYQHLRRDVPGQGLAPRTTTFRDQSAEHTGDSRHQYL
ncbi:hypothetical protein E2C01_071113 [Portunus trituberculatus]|uniref:Uncharacterized protein n=1 Tax=Portunus trituberculatus TaxID=210409 RepID=A0A5B7I4C7_PORTR|nr:hypothetical protein [Portunus trituberculatus]